MIRWQVLWWTLKMKFSNSTIQLQAKRYTKILARQRRKREQRDFVLQQSLPSKCFPTMTEVADLTFWKGKYTYPRFQKPGDWASRPPMAQWCPHKNILWVASSARDRFCWPGRGGARSLDYVPQKCICSLCLQVRPMLEKVTPGLPQGS